MLIGLAVIFAAGCASTNQFCGGVMGNDSCVSVSISPTSAILAAGGSNQFSVKYAGSTDFLHGTTLIWKVNGIVGGNGSVGTIDSNGLYTAPAGTFSTTSVTVTAYVTTLEIQADSLVTVLGAHQVGVRPGSSGAEFNDRASGLVFLPRGNNYIRLATQVDSNGNQTFYHSTFNVGTYDAARADAALTAMRANGYNAVRVFLNGCCANGIGNTAGGLSDQYLANLTDFLARAGNQGIYVIFTSDWLPSLGGYTNQYANCTQFADVNTLNLCAGGVAGAVSFHHDLVQGLIAHSANLRAILAYELRNEYYYASNAAPLNLMSGTVTAADGQTYDMSDNTAKQLMMDNGLIYFTNQVRSAIVALDPTALVTVGFFWPQTPNPTRTGDARVISVYPAIASSSADFVDVHGYSLPNDLTMPQLMQNYGLTGYQEQKPAMMGEFGAFTSDYAQAPDAATALKSWQIAGCPYNLKGWLLWTWDTDEQPQLWNAMSTGAVINQQLAPSSRPDPCSP